MKIQSIRESIIENLPIDEGKKKILNRRLNKLARDPKGFLKGSYNKKSKQILSKTPVKYKGKNNYTVVSAVYNVEKYLGDYFKSLVEQSLNFKKHIQLIMVDDGSTDGSAEIIKEWQKKYPNNIKYVYKKNGGQASARNLGMTYVKTQWVTFIDPDDFVDLNYFQKVDSFISNEPNVSLVSCPFVFYFEDTQKVSNSHPLRYRFNDKTNKYKISKMGKNIQLSVNSAFFKMSEILQHNISFNEYIRPNFEDAKFVGDYTIRIDQHKEAAFIKGTSYFYRKRSDGTSTLDGSWNKVSLYSDVLSRGCLSMLEEAYDKFNYVPKHVQRTVLYHLSWYFKYLVNKDESINILDDEKKDLFLALLYRIFDFIDEETILDFELAGTWFFQRVAWLGFFKDKNPPFQISYVKNVDREKKQVLISYFTYFDVLSSFKIDGKDTIPRYETSISHTFVHKFFVKEKYCWIPFDSENSLLTIKLNDEDARITLNGKHNNRGIYIKDILKTFKPSSKYKTDGSWLLMDRDTQADDNAEHLYNYIVTNHPNQECYFALREESHDWKRLENEGFNLVDFGSKEFEDKLRKSSKIISSHLDNYISNYFNDEYEYSKKFIFLQHGVTKDNLSKWFNTKKNLSRIITATLPEYNSIVKDQGHYKFTEKEVSLTGFPRHDKLLTNNSEDSNIILVMPTWRQNIIGKKVADGNTREINQSFMNTGYAQHWYNLIHSERLLNLAKNHDYKIIFAPHANIAPYISAFDVPNYIEIWQSEKANTSMQQLFQQSKLMITDYSSVAFEMGFLNKTTLYYQFDKDEVFSGGHIYQSGYFSYEKDGFGPVATNQEQLLLQLELILQNDGKPLEPYLTRIHNTFAYHDTDNCKRVYEAIVDLDCSETTEVPINNVLDYAQQAISYRNWDLALERVDNTLNHPNITLTEIEKVRKLKENIIQIGYQDEPIKLANILWNEKRLDEALKKLVDIDDEKLTSNILRLRVKLAILNDDFELARESQRLLLEKFNETTSIEDWKFYMQLASV